MVAPLVTVGVPVYNGAPHLSRALRSILAQTFRDFELLICDNASNDATEEICRAFAERDDRVRYIRFTENSGAAANFNRTFMLARGRYFKWAAYDDVLACDYLKACVDILESDPSIALAYGSARIIDETGHGLGPYADPLAASDASPVRRVHGVLWTLERCFAVFGLYRSSILAKTELIRTSKGSDRSLLAEIALHGRIVRLPPELIAMRQTASVRENRDLSWWSPTNAGRVRPKIWNLCLHVISDVWKSNLGLHFRLALAADAIFAFHVRDWRRVAFDIGTYAFRLARAAADRVPRSGKRNGSATAQRKRP